MKRAFRYGKARVLLYKKPLIDGKTGFVAKDNDIEELAKRIEELLNYQNLLVKMKENVIKITKGNLFDINALVGTFEKLLIIL